MSKPRFVTHERSSSGGLPAVRTLDDVLRVGVAYVPEGSPSEVTVWLRIKNGLVYLETQDGALSIQPQFSNQVEVEVKQ